MEPHNSFTQLQKDQIIFNKRQVSMLMASMIILCLFIFIVGYFLGKRTVMNDFSSDVTQHALHDQIDYLLTTQSLQSSRQEDSDEATDEQVDLDKDVIISVSQSVVSEKVQNATTPVVEQKNHKVIEEKATQSPAVQVVDENKKDLQYACLVGFGTKTAANAFVARLKKHHVPVILKTMISKTVAGKSRTWYQAITPTYDSSQQLQDVVQKVKRLEHIRDNDIKIVHVK